jgi:hypothetical protein
LKSIFKAFDAAGACSMSGHSFRSAADSSSRTARSSKRKTNQAAIPFPFHSAAELLATAHANELSISQLMLENECALVPRRRRAERRWRWCAKASTASGSDAELCGTRDGGGRAFAGWIAGAAARASAGSALREKEADGISAAIRWRRWTGLRCTRWR